MMTFFRAISIRHLRQRWSRAVLVAASIALGVATLAASRALNQAMHRGIRNAVTPLAGFGDLLVSNGDQGVSRQLLDDLRKEPIPGVREIQPLNLGRIVLPDLNQRTALLIGVELGGGTRAAASWGIETRLTSPLALLPGRKPAFAGSELHRDLAGHSSRLRVRTATGETTLDIVGTVDAWGPAAGLGGSVVYLPLDEAGKLLGRPGLLGRIDLALDPDADRDQVRRRVEHIVAGRAQVRTPEANDRMVRDVVGGIELGFALGGFGALIVGLFLVYNALAVSVAERRHEIGILRSLGATRSQIALLFAGEAALLGLVGSIFGIPLGIGLAEISVGPLRQVLSDIFLPMEDRVPVQVTPGNMLLAGAVGILTAFLASLVPAILAAQEEPADAIRWAPRMVSWRFRLVQAGCCVALVGAGLACFAARAALPDRVGTFASGALILIGGLTAMPLWTGIAARLLQPVARPFLGIEGRLAADNLARSPGRTGLVVAALAAGTALFIETAGLTYSSETAIIDWVEQAFVSELVVTANSPIPAGGESQEMSEDLVRQLSLPGVESVVPVRFRRPYFRDKMIFLIALDASSYHQAVSRRGPVPSIDLYPRLSEPGTVMISDNFAARHGVAVGESITLRGLRGPMPLRVIGTVVEYSWNQGTVVIDRVQYKELFDDAAVDAIDVFLQPGADAEEVRQTMLRRFGAEQGLIVLTQEEVRQTIASMIRRLYRITNAQQLMIMLVAGLGVVMAMLISVLQRRRELGLLRAVGAMRSQVLRSLLAEAALIGLLGAAIGVLLGIPLEWYAVRIILFEETGFLFPLRVPWLGCALVIGTALTTAILAGLVPAMPAMRLQITEAIAYE